ncbi:helix-turn-helix domain-containing protein [Rhodococcus sp. 1R11]|uniref:helix-turn-helix domain-containing protein n=1 Tax=Rhodococcus sp. 1R11 TaxID=2559614 RepID=UPI00107292FB|nr:helix-turn-helix domain-containing protein [Rhodococcus sp. 1R11]TFI42469.1 helix-turn-helix domain-containing protein [Rhodococcus sp. 1R11]
MPEGLGARLREARQRRGLSLRSLANALGVSASLVSQVEMGKTQPSVATLYAMASHLEVSLDDLVGNDVATDHRGVTNGLNSKIDAVQRKKDNPLIEMENGVQWERMAYAPGGPADSLLVTYQPGACSSVDGKMMRHSGIEYAYLLEGELTLNLEFDVVTLSTGDSLCFDSTRPHMYSNRGTVKARGLWTVVGRRDSDLVTAARPSTDSKARKKASSAVDVLRSIDELD